MKKLNEIQKALVVKKDRYNAFGKYKYRSCEDILKAVKPLLGEATLTISDDLVLIGDRYYVKASVLLTDGQDSISSTAFAREPENKKGMDESQITGTASSYARKYALNGLFGIDDGRDDNGNNDGDNSPQINKPTKEESAVLDTIVEKLLDFASEKNLSPNKNKISSYYFGKRTRYPIDKKDADEFVKHITATTDLLKQVCDVKA